MLAFGILGLFGMGIAMSMSGGGDDESVAEDIQLDEADTAPAGADTSSGLIEPEFFDPEVDQGESGSDDWSQEEDGEPTEEAGDVQDDTEVAQQDSEAQSYDRTTRNELIQTYVPIVEVDAETQARIDDFLEGLDPAQRIDDAADAFRAFVTDLGVEIIDTTDMTGAEEAEEDTPPPPMGEEFRDPLVVAEELEALRIQQEIEAEIARQPENLVTVTDGDGGEVPDESILFERDETADPDDPLFTVTAPEGAHDINVRFDAEHTFLVEYSADTVNIAVGLNSHTDGPDGSLVREITYEPDENGVDVRTLSWTKQFDTAALITVEVAQDHIGAQVGQYDLSNPNDALHFDFADDVTGDLHLVYYESADGPSDDMTTTKRAFVVQTGAGEDAPSGSELAAMLSDPTAVSGMTILSEIYLGEDWVSVNGDPEDGEPYEVRIENFVNDAAMISTNIAWASERSYDDGDVVENTGTGSDPGTIDDPFGGFGGIDMPTIDPILFFP